MAADLGVPLVPNNEAKVITDTRRPANPGPEALHGKDVDTKVTLGRGAGKPVNPQKRAVRMERFWNAKLHQANGSRP